LAFKTFDFGIDEMGSHLRLFISLAVGILVFVGMIALSVFFIAVRGKEQVMVPDVAGKELTAALLELQEKELYPRIQVRATETAGDKGRILEQSPEAGTIVKAERRINLVISGGVALDKVGNYVGRDIATARQDIEAVSLLTVKDPVIYQYSKEPAGTIIQQEPPAGTDLNGPAELALVISRGQQDVRLTVPELEGLSLQAALEKLAQSRAVFTFRLAEPGDGDAGGTVASQSPLGGTEINSGDTVTVTLYTPKAAAGEAAGLFRHTLPRNPYPLPVTVDALLPGGVRRNLAAINHPGGEFALPYLLPEGSTIVISMLGRELRRQPVQAAE
jgi:beta-lactam-binding protein with PASTA domain